jgi:hypothetical protein
VSEPPGVARGAVGAFAWHVTVFAVVTCALLAVVVLHQPSDAAADAGAVARMTARGCAYEAGAGDDAEATARGLVVVRYRDDDAPYAAVRARFPDDVVLVRDAAVAGAVVASAWRRRLRCAADDPAAVATFVARFRRRGPEPRDPR